MPPSPTPSVTATKIVPATLQNVPTQTPTPTLDFTRQQDTLPDRSDGDSLRFTPTPTVGIAGVNLSHTLRCSVIFPPLTLYAGPSQQYQAGLTLQQGDALQALKRTESGGWLLVKTEQDEIGWVDSTHLNCPGNVVALAVVDDAAFNPEPSPTLIPTMLTPPEAVSEGLSFDYWQADYYDNASLLGEPVFRRQDHTLDFNWILDSPDPLIPADNFSVRWSRLFDFVEGGDYRFFAEADDGLRLYVDGWLVIDSWQESLPVPLEGRFADIEPGPHTIVVEYFESGGHARVKVWAEKSLFVDSHWTGEYYPNRQWEDPTFMVRNDADINFDWEHNAPIYGLDHNDFSIRWRRTLFFDPGNYTFFVDVADRDRVRLYLDGWQLTDTYRTEAGIITSHFADLEAGYHTLTVEYQETVGKAKVKLWWEKN